MIKLTAFLFMLAVEASSFAQLAESPLREQAISILDKPIAVQLAEAATMSPPQQLALVNYIKTEINKDEEHRQMYERTLVVLRDEETIAKYLGQDSFYFVGETLDPRVFELIAPAMFRNDEKEPRKDYSLPPSVRAQEAISMMLVQIPQVPEAVKGWIAKFAHWQLDYLEMRQLFRDWWTENELAWKRRDFGALRPGRDMSHKDIHIMRAAALAARANAVATPPEYIAPSLLRTPPPSTSASPSDIAQSSHSWIRCVVVVGLALLSFLVIGVFIWRVVRKQRM